MTEEATPAYRVLARKYRPRDFDGLIGQEALVRILTNAIASGRIAQAFMLTGVRGVGKTTTARIIAKALNCIGPDGTGGPTAQPCGTCDACVSITADRHVDVQELDAASRTGVDDIRELIEGVRYRPISARYKVYILDEVHMLSRNAFNALLKTLEEPPEHVKFIFATTDIRKVPVTVLSRCQRFDLRRVPLDRLSDHFRWVVQEEGRGVEDEAIALVARAADGSVRDGLSILDQAIALSDGEVTAASVRDMLGLADRSQVFDLFEKVLQGQSADVLDLVDGMYASGADPVVVVQDMLDVCHAVTRIKLTPEMADDPRTPELERSRGGALAKALSMPVLSRTWQMLLKGLGETQHAPNPIQALEMLLIRLMHVGDMPTPGDLVRKLQQQGTGSMAGSSGGAPGASSNAPTGRAPGGPTGSSPSASVGTSSGMSSGPDGPALRAIAGGGTATAAITQQTAPAAKIRLVEDVPSPAVNPGQAVPEPVPGAVADAQTPPEPVTSIDANDDGGNATAMSKSSGYRLETFDDLVALVEQRREGRLWKTLVHDVHLVSFAPGRIEIRLTSSAPRDICSRLSGLLETWLEEKWVITVSGEAGEITVAEKRAAAEQKRFDAASRDPLVQAVMDAFPKARIEKVTPVVPDLSIEPDHRIDPDLSDDEDVPPAPEDSDR